MIDGGETDWKLLAIRTDDPLAAALSDVESPTTPDAVRKAMDEIRHWFRVYKVRPVVAPLGFDSPLVSPL